MPRCAALSVLQAREGVNFSAGLLNFDFTLLGEGSILMAAFALSALFLNEKILEWKNVAALGLVCMGIWRVTQEEKPALAAA